MTEAERYRRIVENTLEGVWVYDADGRTTYMNPRMATLLGVAPEAAVGVPVIEFMHAESRLGAAERIARRKQGVAERAEFRLVRADGAELWVSAYANPMFDDAGAYEGSFALVSDITDRRRTELALKASQDQLRQSQKMEAIGSLAGGVAHDFNNLLTVILGCAGMALRRVAPQDRLREELEQIEKAGQRGAALTRQLLAFSRKQVLQPEVLDVNDVVNGLRDMLARLLREDARLTLTTKATGRVHADRGQLEQVIMNIVVNARDAMPNGGTVTIETSTLDLPAGRHVKLSVTDTGIGMDAATQERIFEPFFTTKDKSKGTGLGLSTVYGIIQQSGGSVAVISAPGKGSTFEIYLPETQRERAPLATEPLDDAERGGSETILLVEDEEPVRDIIGSVLRAHGYQVLEAQNGGEAFLLCEQHGEKIHLLLSDMVMPRMSGRQLAERLLKLRPDLKVLFASGYTEDAAALEAGPGFLQKPITPAALLRKVREVLDVAR